MITSETKKTGWFDRLKNGLHKTRLNIIGLFTGGKVDEDFLEELEFALISADMGVQTVSDLLETLRESLKLKGLKTQDEVRLELRDELVKLLKPAEGHMDLSRAKPLVMMMIGVNGAGKTTSIGKISKWLAKADKSVLLAAGDTFRAAAREQLAVWGERNRVEVIAQNGGDPAAVATAGRLTTQTRLMEELKRIARSQNKAMQGAPHEVILVIDGTNGQNALSQVAAFDHAVPLTGLIITKLDGTAKGGVLVAITRMRAEKPIPIYFIGVGETIDDLQPFDAQAFASALVGIS